LGSVQILTTEQGILLEEYSYDAWGLRRDPVTLQVYVPDPETDVEYGFTGHEHLDAFKMINMSGRMYDPVLGRFLSPDPFLQFPDFTQGLNPYSYALNNPLRFVDPDGYSLFGTILAISLQILVTPINPMLGILVYSVVMTIDYAIENGRSVNIFDMGAYFIQTTVWSTTGMGLSKGVGDIFKHEIKTLIRELGRAAAHGITNGGMRLIQGGKFEHGFLSGFVSSLGGSFMQAHGGNMGIETKIALSAALGGTAEALGGGKFANGAVTGAYVMMFNHLQDVIKERNDPWADFEAIDYSEMNDSERAIQILKAWKYSNENGLGGEIPLDRIFTNLKCSNTLKNGGIVINEAGIQFGDKVVEVTIRVPLFNSTKHSQFLGTNVQFGGEGKVNPIGTDWYQLKNATEIIGIKGEDNYDFLLKWVGYE
jgi:RHS repeat-associated protein